MMPLLAANAGIAEENRVPTTGAAATNKFENFVFFIFHSPKKNIKFNSLVSMNIAIILVSYIFITPFLLIYNIYVRNFSMKLTFRKYMWHHIWQKKKKHPKRMPFKLHKLYYSLMLKILLMYFLISSDRRPSQKFLSH